MRKEEFIDAVMEAGWRPVLDAQHSDISKLWEKLFPIVAELELEIEDLKETIGRFHSNS